MITCLHSLPWCLTFGRTPLTPRLPPFLLQPSACLLSLPVTDTDLSRIILTSLAYTSFLQELSTSFFHLSPSSVTACTPPVKVICERPERDPCWFLFSSARGWTRTIQTTTDLSQMSPLSRRS